MKGVAPFGPELKFNLPQIYVACNEGKKEKNVIKKIQKFKNWLSNVMLYISLEKLSDDLYFCSLIIRQNYMN